MKYLSKHLESIAYSLIVLILFQSCVIYDKVPNTTGDLSPYQNQRVKIETTNGYIYKLRWFEESENTIFSIVNTEEHFLNAQDILQIKTIDPNPVFISIDDALNYKGILEVTYKDGRSKIQVYRFIELNQGENIIQGLTKIGGDTTKIVINKDQIKSIKIQDKVGSTAGNVFIGIGIALGLITTIALIEVSQDGWFSWD